MLGPSSQLKDYENIEIVENPFESVFDFHDYQDVITAHRPTIRPGETS